MAKPKKNLGEHSRLSFRARHLIALLRRTRVHSVREAILRELQNEFNRIRGGAARAWRTDRKARKRAPRARGTVRHLRNRLLHGATYYDHTGREIRGGRLGQAAYAQRHAREMDRPPSARDGRRDERTGRQRLRDHAGDHLTAAGRTADGDPGVPPVRRIKIADLREQARADRKAARNPAAAEARETPRAPDSPRPSRERADAARRGADWWELTGPAAPPLPARTAR